MQEAEAAASCIREVFPDCEVKFETGVGIYNILIVMRFHSMILICRMPWS